MGKISDYKIIPNKWAQHMDGVFPIFVHIVPLKMDTQHGYPIRSTGFFSSTHSVPPLLLDTADGTSKASRSDEKCWVLSVISWGVLTLWLFNIAMV